MEDFLQYLPHRPPFLFVDRLLAIDENSIHTQKDVKAEEPFFQGHYPGRPIMPGVLICESVFQAGAILMGRRSGDLAGRVPVITRINNVKFKQPVLPGDCMDVEVAMKDQVGAASYLSGKVTVREKTVLTLEFSAMLVEETQ